MIKYVATAAVVAKTADFLVLVSPGTKSSNKLILEDVFLSIEVTFGVSTVVVKWTTLKRVGLGNDLPAKSRDEQRNSDIAMTVNRELVKPLMATAVQIN